MSDQYSVTDEQRLKWKQLGHAMHFVGRFKCGFHLATLLEGKIIVSTIGEYRPNIHKNDYSLEGLSGQLPGDRPCLYETYVFENGDPIGGAPQIGKQLDSELCYTEQEAYELHKQMCEKFQRRLNKGVYE